MSINAIGAVWRRMRRTDTVPDAPWDDIWRFSMETAPMDSFLHLGRLTVPKPPELPKCGCRSCVQPWVYISLKSLAEMIFGRLHPGYGLRINIRDGLENQFYKIGSEVKKLCRFQDEIFLIRWIILTICIADYR